MPPHKRTAILADGDLPGLVALASAAESQVSIGDEDFAEVILLADSKHLGKNIVGCVQQQSDRIGLSTVSDAPMLITHDSKSNIGYDTDVLVRAASTAVRMGCVRLIWPIAVVSEYDQVQVQNVSEIQSDRIPDPHSEQPMLDAVGAAIDRALLVSRLVSVDAALLGQADLQILTPYVDLTASQLADLALDLDAPIDTCWWGGEHIPLNAATAEAAAARWTACLEAFGWSPQDVSTSDVNVLARRQAEMRAERLT